MISYSRGSVQQRLNQETLKEIPIPIVSNSLQVKIERFLVESWRKRKEAKKLLEQAKHKVEEMIEKEAGVK
jgi:restriction endonuclease S subunit